MHLATFEKFNCSFIGSVCHVTEFDVWEKCLLDTSEQTIHSHERKSIFPQELNFLKKIFGWVTNGKKCLYLKNSFIIKSN